MERQVRLLGQSVFLLTFVSCCSFSSTPKTGITGFAVKERVLLGQGATFGDAGSYETLVGRIDYALDPIHPLNARVTDVEYGVSSDGLVHYSADVVIVKPVDVGRGNGTLLYHVVNRGNFDTRVLNSESWAEIASSPCGSSERMGRLMKQGYTVVFSGWQADLVREEHLRLFVPEAVREGKPISGEVLAEFPGVTGDSVAYLGHPQDWLKIYSVATEFPVEMRSHDDYSDPGQVIEPQRWSFARLDQSGKPQPDKRYVYFAEGFESGKIYTLRYRTSDSPLMGLCFPAVRDLVTFLCGSNRMNPLLNESGECPITHRLAYGSSQCGRFLRDYLYQGFNRSLENKRVFDGVFANVPGCRVGFFNYRHAQPARAWGFFPNFDFPFTDLRTTDPVTGEAGGILDNLPETFQPKIFYVHHSGEYWSSGAALTHVTLEEQEDVALPDNVRIYSLSGTAHGFAPLSNGHPVEMPDYLLPFNPNPTYLVENPLLEALADWVVSGKGPPPSSYPRIDCQELAPVEGFVFPAVPEITAPKIVDVHPRFDWGPRYRQGIIDNPLPRIGELYTVLVPTVDSDGNEVAGIRTPHVEVPVASYTGWNFPSDWFQGASRTCASRLSGAWLPFSASKAERIARADNRLSLEERYHSVDEYLGRLRKAAEDLISRRLMFKEDLELVLEQGAAMYKYVAQHGSWRLEAKQGDIPR